MMFSKFKKKVYEILGILVVLIMAPSLLYSFYDEKTRQKADVIFIVLIGTMILVILWMVL
jgi:hypothetical protein